MSQAHLTKLFSAFGLILLIVVLNSWLATQGAKAILKIPLLHEERRATAFLALAIGSVMLIYHGARRVASRKAIWRTLACSYSQRVAGGTNISTQSTEGQLYRAAILLLFIGLPLASFYHFLGIVWKGHLCVLNAPDQPLPVSAAWFSGIPNATDQTRLVDGLTVVQQASGVTALCQGGIEVFPGWEFILLALFIAAALAASVAFLYTLILTPVSPAKTLASEAMEDD